MGRRRSAASAPAQITHRISRHCRRSSFASPRRAAAAAEDSQQFALSAPPRVAAYRLESRIRCASCRTSQFQHFAREISRYAKVGWSPRARRHDGCQEVAAQCDRHRFRRTRDAYAQLTAWFRATRVFYRHRLRCPSRFHWIIASLPTIFASRLMS